MWDPHIVFCYFNFAFVSLFFIYGPPWTSSYRCCALTSIALRQFHDRHFAPRCTHEPRTAAPPKPRASAITTDPCSPAVLSVDAEILRVLTACSGEPVTSLPRAPMGIRVTRCPLPALGRRCFRWQTQAELESAYFRGRWRWAPDLSERRRAAG